MQPSLTNDIPVEEYFRSRLACTQERSESHANIAKSVLSLAMLIDSTIKDEDQKKLSLSALQQVKMFADKGIEVDELRWADEPPTSWLCGWRKTPPTPEK